jgi:hypothetical protein
MRRLVRVIAVFFAALAALAAGPGPVDRPARQTGRYLPAPVRSVPLHPKKVLLTWKDGSDLDLHVTGPLSRDRGFKLDAWNTEAPGGARLRTSPLPGDMPETAKISRQQPGIYQFYVHDYTAKDEGYDEAMASSCARVEVYFGPQLEQAFDVPVGVSGNTWTVFALQGDGITPMNTMSSERDPRKVGRTLETALLPGDILFGRIDQSLVPGAWSHVAIYAGEGKVIEAASEEENVGTRTEFDWGYPNMTWVTYMRVMTASPEVRAAAVRFAARQLDKQCPYDVRFYSKQANGGSWYCSELVWAAYLNASRSAVDLEHTPDKLGVYPWEIERSDDLAYVGGHYEREPVRTASIAYMYLKLVWEHLSAWTGQVWHQLWK